MDESGNTATMARPKGRKGAGGRPPEPEPLRSIMSVKGTEAFEVWLDGLVDHVHLGTRTLLIRNALREFGENHGYGKPQPKR